MPGRNTALVLVFCFAAVFSPVTSAADKVVESTGMWAGKIKDESLREPSGVIADAKTWSKLWTAWRPGQELPKVDFTREVILVGTVAGPNLVVMRPTVDDDGDVKFIVGGTRIGGPGFGYKLIKISKNGVKAVNGRSLSATGVQGMFVIPRTVASFEDHTLEIKLWEYDPLLADASATLVDEFRVEKYAHDVGEKTETPFSVASKLQPRQDRRYYITAFVLNRGKRTHIGEQNGKSGLCKVLTNGNPSTVKMIARSVTVARPRRVGDAGASTGKPDFLAIVRRTDTRVRFLTADEMTIFDISSGFGIDNATIRRQVKEWPKKILVRLHLGGLESFKVERGDTQVEWSVSSTGDNTSRVSLRNRKNEKTLDETSELHTKVRIVGGNGKIPLKDGYFEVPLPARLFAGNPPEITLKWIDFYRN